MCKVTFLFASAIGSARWANADCDVTFGWQLTGGDPANSAAVACTAGTGTLADTAQCYMQPKPGYTSNYATGGISSYTCTGTTLSSDFSLAVSGCTDNYYMSAGSDASDIVCTPCAAGTKIATMPHASGVQTCSACDGGTAGDCATGCPANYFQSAGTTAADIECTACAAGATLGAAAVSGTVTQCASCTDGSTAGGCATGCPANFFQSAGTMAADIECTACDAGKTSSAAAVSGAPTTCTATLCAINQYVSSNVCTDCAPGFKAAAGADASSSVLTCSACDGATAGDCATGCPADFFQSAGTTAGDIECTACAAGQTLAAAAVKAASTICEGSVAKESTTQKTNNSTSIADSAVSMSWSVTLTAAILFSSLAMW